MFTSQVQTLLHCWGLPDLHSCCTPERVCCIQGVLQTQRFCQSQHFSYGRQPLAVTICFWCLKWLISHLSIFWSHAVFSWAAIPICYAKISIFASSHYRDSASFLILLSPTSNKHYWPKFNPLTELQIAKVFGWDSISRFRNCLQWSNYSQIKYANMIFIWNLYLVRVQYLEMKRVCAIIWWMRAGASPQTRLRKGNLDIA